MKSILRYILIAIALLAVVLIIGFAAGYRFGPGLSIVKVGTIEVTNLPSGTTVILNEDRKTTTNEAVDSFRIGGVLPESHTLLVSREGYWPWAKDVVVPENETITFAPFFVPRSSTGVIITDTDPAYATIRGQITSHELPRSDSPLYSNDETIAVWVNDKAVHARWEGEGTPPYFFCTGGICPTETVVFTAFEDVRDLSFLPGRRDVLAIATGHGVIALEMDRRGTPQNFQPIYEGQSPIFAPGATSTLYVLDEPYLYEISI